MNELISERAVIDDVVSRLKELLSESFCCEVPLLGRCVDLVFIKRKSLTSIEFKLTNWRRALSQAKDHRLGVDFAYVCMPEREVTKEMKFEFKQAGVGLFFYQQGEDWPFKEIVKAPKSKEVWSVARTNVLEYLQERRTNGL
ncbi:MAG: hypothetical protein H6754_08920 [Candidatus Omnitrophica bacterium]|nr:hypothetical protein [Candidatus Omnitrophota bacterium]